MHDRVSDIHAPVPPAPLERLVALLRDGDVDGALDAGLLDTWPPGALDALGSDARALLIDTRDRLRVAWDARARHLQRQARLARRVAERAAARAPAASATPAPSSSGAPARPALPAAAAAILARARSRAGGSPE